MVVDPDLDRGHDNFEASMLHGGKSTTDVTLIGATVPSSLAFSSDPAGSVAAAAAALSAAAAAAAAASAAAAAASAAAAAAASAAAVAAGRDADFSVIAGIGAPTAASLRRTPTPPRTQLALTSPAAHPSSSPSTPVLPIAADPTTEGEPSFLSRADHPPVLSDST
eukprot:CAMPEP_0113670652 /NCGR_PEP_ID=MMETSP0038_2-20120614/5258_1 /TAXON_ID=2898 /ORGANISM="Cryptomonas paramecium" /LENGTH=165 /DNA_ID=CAMNT_0000586697 /DNA_START=313 /DNA_END=807 /DNA_ORIENTATION=+ /assembly_acc=CAM_ASM_000170